MSIPEDQMWIQPDPNGDPGKLRFAPGSLVMFLFEEYGWVEGEVLKVCMRLQIPPEFSGTDQNQAAPPILYVVWPHSEVPDDLLGTHWIHHDTDHFIRPRLVDIQWDPNEFNPALVPAESDPLSHLYTGIAFDTTDEDGNDIAQHWNTESTRATTNPDGSITVKSNDGQILGRSSTSIGQFPQGQILGVDAMVVMSMVTNITNRQDMSFIGIPVVDPETMFRDWAPQENSLIELEQAAKQSSEKMLLLGDALMCGVHGWSRDSARACNCYRAAAWGCQENELEDRNGIPVGSPVAMVAFAHVAFEFMKKQLGYDVSDAVSPKAVFTATLRDEQGFGIFGSMLFWLAEAARRGHMAPFMLLIASEVNDMTFTSQHRIPERDWKLLRNVCEYRNREIAFQDLQQTGAIPRGDPPNEIIERFAMKSSDIFKDMPVSTDVVHIEYRQISQAPFPYVVFTIVPKRKEIIKVVLLPEYLQMSPFSEESFDYAWRRIAFDLHLGSAVNGKRERPLCFTILDSHGNRQFAEYLRIAINDDITEVRLVNHAELISKGRRRRPVQLGSIIHDVEKKLLEIPNFLVSDRATDQSIMFDSAGTVDRIAAEILAECEAGQIVARAIEIKEQGNELFQSSDFPGATKCYSIVLGILRLLTDSTDESNLLIGTSLSNRAACFLEMESQRSSVAFQKLLLQNAIRDCTCALKSNWSNTTLPRRLREKLKFRLDKAQARLDVIQHDFQSEISSIIFPPPRQQVDLQQEAGTVAPSPPNVPAEATEDISAASLPDEAMVAPAEESTGRVDNNVSAILEEPRLGETLVVASRQIRERESGQIDDLMLERGLTFFDSGLATNSRDGCPVCLREFHAELSFVYSAVLPCGQHAVCVECLASMKKQSDKEKIGLYCPLCRFAFEGTVIQQLAYQIIEKDDALCALVERFPGTIEESNDVAVKLCWKWNFRLEKVVDALEQILDDKASGIFFRTAANLDHNQKEEIYQMARRPVCVLQGKEKQLSEELRATFETTRSNEINKKLHLVRSELAAARLKARDDIYERLNSVGNMGAQDAGNVVLVDYHGLHLSEMHSKYEDLVEAILPVVKKVTVITGRGLHSEGGSSKLMKSLKKKIEKTGNTRWQTVPNNPGALIIHWLET